ncbi:MAG: class I SAM-dependent methyltransferase [Clostridium sp.]|nr:class I SAM-dependent methyltransferase [Clostridium sp.]
MKENSKVKNQYKNDNNLQTRISIHEKYSVNKQGFGNWIIEQYDMREGYSILELGCGNGSMWKNHINEIPERTSLILTDFSNGMLEKAKENLHNSDKISFENVDIQSLPYEDKSFDIIIANMMLYHVPDLNKALEEVKRVLKDNGTFYCATFGENGITNYIKGLINDAKVKEESECIFTLQNGEGKLRKYFNSVVKRNYEDALEITNTEDLVDYVISLKGIEDFNKISREELTTILDRQKVSGKIVVPKEYGMFISKK